MVSRSRSGSSLSKDGEKGDVKSDLQPTQSMGQGDMIEMVDTTNGQFHRSFTPHQVHVCIYCVLISIQIPADEGIFRSYRLVPTSVLGFSSVPVLLWPLVALETWSLLTSWCAHAFGLSCSLSLK